MIVYLNTNVAIDQLRGKAEMAGRIGAKVCMREGMWRCGRRCEGKRGKGMGVNMEVRGQGRMVTVYSWNRWWLQGRQMWGRAHYAPTSSTVLCG